MTARTSCAHPPLVQPAVLLPRVPLAPMSLRGPESVATTSIQSEHRLKGHHRCAIMENGAFLSPVVGNHLLPALLDLYYAACGNLTRNTREMGLLRASDKAPSPGQSRPVGGLKRVYSPGICGCISRSNQGCGPLSG